MSVAASIKAFLDNPRFLFWGVVVGTGIEIAGWALNFPQGWEWARPVGFALTLFFLGRLAWTQYWEAERYRQDALPKFEMVFLPENDVDSRPYVQTLNFRTANHVEWTDRRYRVGITSLSTQVVPSVHVVLARCDPGGNFIHVGHRLLVMDSDPPEAERDLVPNPAHEPTLWFDVVSELDVFLRRPKSFTFCYSNPGVRGLIDDDRRDGEELSYVIALRASGGGATHERSFRVTKQWDGQQNRWHRLHMEPL